VPILDTTVPALVLKMGRYPIHHGTLGVIRSLGRLGVEVYAVVEDRFIPSAMSRYLTGSFSWKKHGAEEPYLTGLSEIGRRLGRPAILVPTDDYAAAFIAEHSADLERSFLFPRLPRDLPRRLANKRTLSSLCTSVAVPHPEVAFPTSLEEVHAFLDRASFPVVVKAADAHLLPDGARSTSLARSPKELLAIYELAAGADASNLIFQEYIPFSSAEDWIFHGYSNPQTGCWVSFTGKKLRSYPPFAGPTTLGVTVPNEALAMQSEKMLKAIGYAGIVDLDYRFDKRDGQYKLLDFNPRIGANFRMFENADGVDVVRALHLDITGRAVPQSPPVYGRKLLVESHDLSASLGYLRHGGLTFGGWWQSLRGKKELAWFSWEDPLPASILYFRLLCRLVGRALGRAAVLAGHLSKARGERRRAAIPEGLPQSNAIVRSCEELRKPGRLRDVADRSNLQLPRL
jgi:D-aspartate ligase